jgi:hypothetical protein
MLSRQAGHALAHDVPVHLYPFRALPVADLLLEARAHALPKVFFSVAEVFGFPDGVGLE